MRALNKGHEKLTVISNAGYPRNPILSHVRRKVLRTGSSPRRKLFPFDLLEGVVEYPMMRDLERGSLPPDF